MCVCGKDVVTGTRVARRSPSGQLPGFFLGLQCRRERQELSVEILGKDQHIPRWVRKSSMWKVKTAAPRKHCKVGNLTLGTKPAQ